MYSSLRTRALLLGVMLCASIATARAQERLVVDLDALPAGGVRATTPQAIKLSAEKPANLTREPVYRVKPLYGVIKLGDAKNNQIVVALEPKGADGKPRLFVDANGDGDLTNDPAVTLAILRSRPENATTRTINDERVIGAEPLPANVLGAVVPTVTRYNLTGRAGTVDSVLVFMLKDDTLLYNRAYSREGKLVVGGRAYRVALVDQNLDGRFDQIKHDADVPPRVTLLIDKNDDGRFDMRTEAFDASKPIRLGGSSYEVEAINVRGTRIMLRPSTKSAHNMLTAADLKVGGDVIDFEADRIGGKSVHFPDDFKGRVVMLDFWASWCPPCREEIPGIVAAYDRYHEKGFSILGVSLDATHRISEQAVVQFCQQKGMNWPQIYDSDMETAKKYGVEAIPTALLVDGDTGKIIAMGDALRGEGLTQALEQAFADRRK